MRNLRGFTGTYRKCALTEDNLLSLLDHFTSRNLDNLLFISIVFSSFHALLQLGETTQPDTPSKRLFRKVTLCHSVKLTPSTYLFILPTHKVDCFFESSTILIQSRPGRLPSTAFHGLSRSPRHSLPLSCPTLAPVNGRGPHIFLGRLQVETRTQFKCGWSLTPLGRCDRTCTGRHSR